MSEAKTVPVEPSILERHARIGALLAQAGLDANHPAMIDWAAVGFELRRAAAPATQPEVRVHAEATEPSEVAGGEIERLRGIEARYNELLYAVTDKQEGRTRHETALGYIQAVDNIGNYHKCYQEEKAS